MYELQQEFGGANFVTASRIFIREGDLSKVDRPPVPIDVYFRRKADSLASHVADTPGKPHTAQFHRVSPNLTDSSVPNVHLAVILLCWRAFSGYM